MRPTHGSTVSSDADPAAIDRLRLEDSFAEESARLLRGRIVILVVIYLLFVGAAAALEVASAPARSGPALLIYVGEIAAACLGVVAVRAARTPGAVLGATTALATALALLIAAYGATTGLHADTLAMGLLCHLAGVVVILPWGGIPQAIVGVASLGAFVAAVPSLTDTQFVLYAELAIATTLTSSVVGAIWLRRHRHDAFVRAVQLAHATAAEREKSEILSALLRVGDVLGRQLGGESALAEVNRLATQTIGCDWSSTFIYEPERRIYRLLASHGVSPAVLEDLSRIEFAQDGIPLLAALEPGVVLEIRDAGAQSLVPLDMMRRLETASAMYTPIASGAEIRGVLVNGFRERIGPFSEKERRISLGIGNAIAVALENQRLVSDLKAANQLKSDFVSTMSHELRTPLNVISGFSELLSDGTFGALNAEQSDAVARIRRSGAQLFELVTATLDLSRLESGRETVAMDRIDFESLFVELRHELEVRKRGRGPEVRWTNHIGKRRLYGDRAKIKTILRNLVGNAVKFTPSGSVDVVADLEAERLVCTVADTGVGIEAKDLSSIFEMFRQVDASSTRAFEGVGLGLFIVKSLTEVLGGSVEVQSTPKVGSTFTVRIPIHVEGRDGPEARHAAP